MPSTQSRTSAKAGSAAITAPKPTRLATLITGSAEALRPASTLSRSDFRRLRLQTTSTTMARLSATITDQTPPTLVIEVSPQRASARKPVSMRGRMPSVIVRLTAITTISGSSAMPMLGNCSLWAPCSSSAGSKPFEAVARSRITGSCTASVTDETSAAGPPKPSPASRARPSARFSHHMPNVNMIAAAMKPSPGAANGVVPKNGIGIAFWIAGVPGRADIVKVAVPSITVAGSSRFGMSAARNSAWPIGASTNIATKTLTPP